MEDSIRTVELYSDVIVLRHFASGSAGAAAAALGERDGDGPHTPLINAGDGPGQHPSQALLDVYTIRKELGRLDNLTVGLVGDLANGRTVRSLVYLLGKYTNIKFYFVAPDVVRMKDDIKEYLDEVGMEWEEADDLMAVASQCDVLYQTRIQKERFGDRVEDYESARGKYIIDNEVMAVLPQEACVMHPLPRVDEIAPEVDADPRAAYFRQAQNGLFIRMVRAARTRTRTRASERGARLAACVRPARADAHGRVRHPPPHPPHALALRRRCSSCCCSPEGAAGRGGRSRASSVETRLRRCARS